MNTLIDEIKAEFADENGWQKTTPIADTRVRVWMQSDDLEVLGAVHRLLRFKGGLERTQPPLKFREYHEFMTRYYERCLCEYDPEVWNPDWAEAQWGFEATHGAVDWFLELWGDKSVSSDTLHQTKAWFAKILRECPAVSELLSTAIYDHLLSQRSIRKFFCDWEADPQLSRFLE
jgi:hypothetical protein